CDVAADRRNADPQPSSCLGQASAARDRQEILKVVPLHEAIFRNETRYCNVCYGTVSPKVHTAAQLSSLWDGAANMIRRTVLAAFLVFAALSSASQASEYPARPVSIVVPFPAGGPTDALTRI